MKISTFLALICLFIATTAQAQSIFLSPFSTGYVRPIAIEHCGDSRVFVAQQRGIIYVCDSLGVRFPTPFLNLTSIVSPSGNEMGLLGLAFHPNYAQNGYFYVNYTGVSDGNTRIARYTRSTTNPNLADAASGTILMTIPQPYTNHNGGNIEFGADGYLYIGMGDGGSAGDPQGYAQNKQSRLGKMLRIDVDAASPYAIPPTNPFVGNTAYLPEIWATGYRNPWRFSFDRLTHDMWVGDVGQGTWEEIDHEPAGVGGRNYGWNCYEGTLLFGGVCPTGETYTTPVFQYDNSSEGCSVTGGIVYRGAQFADLYANYVFADYCSGRFWAANADAPMLNFAQIKDTVDYQFSTFGEDVNGELYIAGLGNGTIYRVNSNNCTPRAQIVSPSTTICQGYTYTMQALYGRGFSYQWQLNGTNIVGANNITYTASQTGNYTVVVSKAATSCSAVSPPITLTIKPTPQPVILGNPTVCIGGATQHTYSVQNPSPGFLYEWNIISGMGTIISGQGTPTVTVDWSGGVSGTLEVIETHP